jgi:hypothetical protein
MLARHRLREFRDVVKCESIITCDDGYRRGLIEKAAKAAKKLLTRQQDKRRLAIGRSTFRFYLPRPLSDCTSARAHASRRCKSLGCLLKTVSDI